ncbi:MAG TPA: transposase [Thermoplasmata archaeon]|nr:transposase [Thermoplasmata archaeon]
MDEVRFEQYGSRCRMWVPPEDRDPVVRHHPTSASMGYFGAVRLRDGRFVRQREPKSFNGESCFAFLKYLRQVTAPSGPAVVIADNASYHHAALHREWREACAGRLALDFLPAYAPELNPGSSPATGVPTTGTSPPWTRSSAPWRPSSTSGGTGARRCGVYAQSLKTLRLGREKEGCGEECEGWMPRCLDEHVS